MLTKAPPKLKFSSLQHLKVSPSSKSNKQSDLHIKLVSEMPKLKRLLILKTEKYSKPRNSMKMKTKSYLEKFEKDKLLI